MELNGICYFDLHTDTLTESFEKKQPLFGCFDGDLSINFKKTCRFLAIYTPDKFHKNGGMARFTGCIRHLNSEFDANPEKAQLCVKYSDALSAYKQNKTAVFISVENAAVLDGDIENLEILHQNGVRVISLSWNDDNMYASGALTKYDRGLTKTGIAALSKMASLGIMLDVSHLSRRSFFQALDIFDGSVLATHSNCYKICKNPRNLDDEQIKTILKRGGIIGLNLHAPFVKSKSAINSRFNMLDMLFRHYEHICDLGGADNVAFGSDFDGTDNLIREISDIADIPKIYDRFNKLIHANFQNSLLEKLFFLNAEQFFIHNM